MRRRSLRPRRASRGIALLIVLWACTLLAVTLGGFALLAHTEGTQARFQFAQTRAHYAAEAGLARAIYGLHEPQPALRWQADGRPYTFDFDGARVTVTATDEGGKVDLNNASPVVLQRLFHAAGVPLQDAQALAAAVVDWREFDYGTHAALPGYAKLGYKPRHAPFASIEELQQVAGMTPALYRAVADQLTIWSGRDSPDPATASGLALQAIPNMTEARAQQILAARLRPQTGPPLFGGVGTTHSIRSAATLADGTRAVLHATVRLQGRIASAQPYAVLHWQEGDRE